MFNPLTLFLKELLDELIKRDKKYFVRQSYPRGMIVSDETIKGSYLITHYDDLLKATQHYNALTHDPNRYLYHWEKEEDRNKLEIAASQPAGYKVYAAVTMPDIKPRLEIAFKEPVKRFIDTKLNWKGKRTDTAHYNLFFLYGELHLHITLKNHAIKVALIEVEKFK
ncbi:MAG: hypothetical protein ABI723_12925 [Bacteroidia bacterium]